ncbi:MAG TPA: bifunctional glutamate N-acetyltransferase/amino-acid acetyltransferase ArgJ [Candidatus Binataceae bacterium]|nr:bifunctional glutamate N-acetyltransferase/amino-acid acetyltransferase ArgJ [Candidatus Binataceae bacterium]
MEVKAEPRLVAGFRFAAVAAGLKTDATRKDLGLIVADAPAAAAAIFTTNQVKAAPVILSQRRLRSGQLRAVAANSGSANCFTGKAGMKLAVGSCAAVASELGCAEELVVPCSTGVIGHLYDLEKYRAGVREACAALSTEGLGAFATAIMTTDTKPKLASTTLRMGGATVTIAGTAKGAGMIAPNLATMLAFIVTDAALPAPALRRALANAAPASFNAITVDGDMSTNDTLMLLASGAAANRKPAARELGAFEAAVGEVAESLARQLVYDGEGASKFVTVEVRGARSTADAARAARQIANSPLVKTAFFGNDPNVGRITAAAGACGVRFDPDRIELWVDRIRIAARGMILTQALPAAAQAMRQREFSVRLDLKQGSARFSMMTCDLSYDYVKINAEYTT